MSKTRLSIELADDVELRAAVMKLVSGQVVALLRQDANDVVKDLLTAAIHRYAGGNLDAKLSGLIDKEIPVILRKEALSWMDPDHGKSLRQIIQDMVKEEVTRYMTKILRERYAAKEDDNEEG